MSIGALVTRRGRSSRAPKDLHGLEHRLFLQALVDRGLPAPVTELRFASPRRWRFDYAFPLNDSGVALEVEGGAFVRGRHTRGVGFVKDMEKYSEAAARGWLLIRVTPAQLLEERTMDWIVRAMAFVR